ncbi:MAG: tetratricopeptide repeat protein [candidate division NC10 bacterium]|nr:tetratricopeptide repeat protein [candidate division NC10 bacterium]
MKNGAQEDVFELVRRLENRQRRRLFATFIGLLLAAALAGIIVRLSYSEARKHLSGVGVPIQDIEQGREELERVRKEMLQVKAQTDQAQKELAQVRREKLRVEAGAQQSNRGGAQANRQSSSRSAQLVEMQKQVNRLQQELSATQQQLKQERRNAVVLTEEATRYREGAAELQRRVVDLDKSLDEHRYFVLVNEALAYTYRMGAGDKERAEAAYRNAVQMAKAKEIQDPVIYNAYALFLQEQRRFEEAETFYTMALEVKPDYGTALYNLGTLYETRGDLKRALEYYKAADEVGEKLGRENYLRLRSITTK